MVVAHITAKLQFTLLDLLGSMVTCCLYMGMWSMLWANFPLGVQRESLLVLALVWLPFPFCVLGLLPRRGVPELSPGVSGMLLGRCCAWASLLGCVFSLVLIFAPWGAWSLTLVGSMLGTATCWMVGMATLVYLEGGAVAQRPPLFDAAAWFYYYLLCFALPGSTCQALWTVFQRPF